MTPLRILLVEDHDDTSWSSALLLRKDGHEVDIAPDGPSAIAMIEGNHYGVVLLNIQIPGRNGWEVARHIRDREGRRTIIIAVTGFGSPRDIEKSFAAGADHHLIKPVNPELLQSVLASAQEKLQAV